jgi:hypothetical protein
LPSGAAARKAEIRLPADVPAVGVEFVDEHPDHFTEGLGSFEGDHHVGEPGGQVVFLLLGERSL